MIAKNDSRWCPRCAKDLALTEFYASKNVPYCKVCACAYARGKRDPSKALAYERRNRPRRRQLEAKYYRNNQARAIEAYGGKCECCGETEHKFLEIDHINGGGSKERRANKDTEGFYRKLIAEHPEGFRVLCSNCNRGRWRNGGECPHKTKQLEAHALEENPWYLQRFTQVM